MDTYVVVFVWLFFLSVIEKHNVGLSHYLIVAIMVVI